MSLGLAGLYQLQAQKVRLAQESHGQTSPFQDQKVSISPEKPLFISFWLLNEPSISTEISIFDIHKLGETYISPAQHPYFDPTIDSTCLLSISLDTKRLYLLFPSNTIAKAWKMAVNTLLTAFFHPSDVTSPRTPLRLRRCLGLLFDITEIDKGNSLKMTFLRPTGAFVEFSSYVKSREEVLQTLGNRLDPGNLAVLKTFVEDMDIVEKQEKDGNYGSNWLNRISNATIGDFSSEIGKLQKRHSNLSILQRNLSSSVASFACKSPLCGLFDLLNLHFASVNYGVLQIYRGTHRRNSRSQPASPHKHVSFPMQYTNFRRPQSPAKPVNAVDRRYRDACDCRLS